MAAPWNCADKTSTPAASQFCNQVYFTGGGTNILWDGHHDKLVAGGLDRAGSDGQSRVRAGAGARKGKRSRAKHVSLHRRVSNQTNDGFGDELKLPRAKVRGRAVGQQLRTDRGELGTRAITPPEYKLLFASISGAVTLGADELEGDNGRRRLRGCDLREYRQGNDRLQNNSTVVLKTI
jgi:hypothetical protein